MPTEPKPLILIIDDDAVSRLTLTRLLTRQGYSVEFAENGKDGLWAAQNLEPDLILLDVIMPDLSGFEVCKRLREHELLAEVPVVMITSLEDQQFRIEGLEAGADDFITKPYQPDELKARVKTIVRLNRYRRLRKERARADWIIENAEEGYIIVNERGEVLTSNKRAVDLLGFEQDEEMGDLRSYLSKNFKLLPAKAWDLWPALPSDQSLELLRPETPLKPASWISVNAHSQTVRHSRETLLQLKDVTTQKNTQQSVWTFESLISHKLRTPLTNIAWGVTFLSKKAHKLSPEQIKEFADQAQSGVRELKTELEEVLKYINAPTSVPSGGGYQLSRLEHDLNETASQLEVRPIKLVVEGKLPKTLYLSHAAFELILFELAQNSKKFHPKNDPDMCLTIKGQVGKVHITFCDDGVNLTPEQLRKVLLPYYQAEKNFTGQVPGMGLGLTMINTMVLKVGGEVSLRNASKGHGLRVELTIPETP